MPQRGYKMDMIKMAHENAETFLEERRRQWQHQIDKTGGAVKKLAEVLDLPRLPGAYGLFRYLSSSPKVT